MCWKLLTTSYQYAIIKICRFVDKTVVVSTLCVGHCSNPSRRRDPDGNDEVFDSRDVCDVRVQHGLDLRDALRRVDPCEEREYASAGIDNPRHQSEVHVHARLVYLYLGRHVRPAVGPERVRHPGGERTHRGVGVDSVGYVGSDSRSWVPADVPRKGPQARPGVP